MRVGIIGCGLIGRKRAFALPPSCQARLFCDLQKDRAEALAAQFQGSQVCCDWREAVRRADIDIIVISTTHDVLALVAAEAAANGKHVLVEKPCARRAAELDPVLRAIRASGVCARAGFNHRYHRSLQKAREIFDSGLLGELMFIRGRYGHGGRPGYDKEWRAMPEISGGGEAIDQGVHLIDLARWFAGDFPHVQGHIATYFWDMPVEDNAFFLLRTARNQTAFLHATWTEWKNLFSLEVCGRDGKLEIQGLGGSYGVERLAHYQMRPEMGPPDTLIYEFPQADNSWQREFQEFLEDIRRARNPKPDLSDAQAALRIVEQVYEESRS